MGAFPKIIMVDPQPMHCLVWMTVLLYMNGKSLLCFFICMMCLNDLLMLWVCCCCYGIFVVIFSCLCVIFLCMWVIHLMYTHNITSIYLFIYLSLFLYTDGRVYRLTHVYLSLSSSCFLSYIPYLSSHLPLSLIPYSSPLSLPG